jgi:hypothetical protein
MNTIRCSRRAAISARLGFSLLEVAISSLLVGVVMVGSMRVLGQSIQSQRLASERMQGQYLAEGLLSESLQLAYMQPGAESSSIGRESGENPRIRSTFNDVDDFDGYNATPPLNVDGSTMNGLNGWRRVVRVRWVDPNNIAQTRTVETQLKRIQVDVFFHDRLVATATGLKANLP